MGFDTDLLLEPADPNLICSICNEVFKNAKSTPCEHCFCEPCIRSWLSKEKNCPHCRKPLQPQNLNNIPIPLKSMINQLKSRCNYHEKGCHEILTLDRLDQHLASTCQYRTVQCDQGCGQTVRFSDLEKHRQDCSYFLVKCLKCKAKGPSIDLRTRSFHKNLEKKYQALFKDHETQQKKLTTVENERNRFRNQMTALTVESNQQRVQMQELEDEKIDLENKMQELEDENIDLENKVAFRGAEIRRLIEKVGSLERNQQQESAKLQGLLCAKNELQNQVRSLQSKYWLLEFEKGELSEQTRMLRSEQTKKEEEIILLRRSKAETEKELCLWVAALIVAFAIFGLIQFMMQ